MKQAIEKTLLFIMTLSILLSLCACSDARQDAAASSADKADELLRTSMRVVLDGTELGPLYVRDGVSYVEALPLNAVWDQAVSEDGGELRFLWNGVEFTLHDRSETAESAAAATVSFGAPALRYADAWYLPVTALAKLTGRNFYLLWSEEELRCYSAEIGPSCWFAGTWIGPTQSVCGNLCGSLHDLADAAGGALTERDGALVFSVSDRSLLLHPGDTQAEADEASLTLPVPLLSTGEDWLVPLEPVAGFLGLTEGTTEGGGLVYSRVLPDETVVWIDGKKAETFTLPEGGQLVRASDAAAAADGDFLPDGNTAGLMAWGHELSLTGGSAEVLVDGAVMSLNSPVMADGSRWYVSTELLGALGLTELQDPELDQLYYTRIVRHDAIPTGYRVPVLMYHAVGDDIWGIRGLFASPSVLDEQIRSMLEAGCTAVTFEDLDHIDEIEKPVMLTFDDGYDNMYTELFPILQKYKVKATVFMIVGDVGKNHKLTREQIQEMSESGLVSFQSHTMTHSALTILNEQQLRYEHYDSMIGLARITGKQPFVMCYPSGMSSYASRSITAEYYEYGINMVGPCYYTGNDPYTVFRYYIYRDTGVDTFMSYVDQ